MICSLRPTRLALGLLFGVGLLAMPAGLTLAQSNDVRIDSLKIGKGDDVVELKGVAFVGSNLSREEIDALLALDTPADRRTSLGARLKTSSASIFSPAPMNLIGRPVTARIDRAAPPRPSPSARVKIRPVRGRRSWKALAVRTAS